MFAHTHTHTETYFVCVCVCVCVNLDFLLLQFDACKSCQCSPIELKVS